MPRILTLLDYHPVAPVHRERRMQGRPEGVFDGRVVWVSPAILTLYDDRTDAEFWMRFCRCVEVVQTPSLDQWLRANRRTT
jgi:hypothetical protein